MYLPVRQPCCSANARANRIPASQSERRWTQARLFSMRALWIFLLTAPAPGVAALCHVFSDCACHTDLHFPFFTTNLKALDAAGRAHPRRSANGSGAGWRIGERLCILQAE